MLFDTLKRSLIYAGHLSSNIIIALSNYALNGNYYSKPGDLPNGSSTTFPGPEGQVMRGLVPDAHGNMCQYYQGLRLRTPGKNHLTGFSTRGSTYKKIDDETYLHVKFGLCFHASPESDKATTETKSPKCCCGTVEIFKLKKIDMTEKEKAEFLDAGISPGNTIAKVRKTVSLTFPGVFHPIFSKPEYAHKDKTNARIKLISSDEDYKPKKTDVVVKLNDEFTVVIFEPGVLLIGSPDEFETVQMLSTDGNINKLPEQIDLNEVRIPSEDYNATPDRRNVRVKTPNPNVNNIPEDCQPKMVNEMLKVKIPSKDPNAPVRYTEIPVTTMKFTAEDPEALKAEIEAEIEANKEKYAISFITEVDELPPLSETVYKLPSLEGVVEPENNDQVEEVPEIIESEGNRPFHPIRANPPIDDAVIDQQPPSDQFQSITEVPDGMSQNTGDFMMNLNPTEHPAIFG